VTATPPRNCVNPAMRASMSSSSRASAIDAVLMKAAFATPSTFFCCASN
jgi:hypothetical protein